MPDKEQKFSRFLIEEYLRCGSVDEVLRYNNYNLPISYANYQRILDKWGIVKAAGPNSKLNEAIDFLYHLAEKEIPFDALYKKMPVSFRTSAVTLYRILSYVKEGLTRRVGTGVILTPYANSKKVLLAKDISTPRLELGKPYGALTIPMGFSRKRDSREDAILRVLQQEVFTDLVLEKRMPKIIPQAPKPFLFLDIADIRVEIFQIRLPRRWSNLKYFSSFKLEKYRFVDIDRISHSDSFRAGVVEVLAGYRKYLDLKARNLSFNPLQYKSTLNYHLAELPDDPLH